MNRATAATKDLLSARPCLLVRTSSHDSSGLSIHPRPYSRVASLVARRTLFPACLPPAFLAAARFAGVCRFGSPWLPFFPYLGGERAPRRQTSEYHTGYRAFARTLLERLPLKKTATTSFSTIKSWLKLWLDCAIGEVTCPARYMAEASSINFRRRCSLRFRLPPTALEYRWAKIRGHGDCFRRGATKRVKRNLLSRARAVSTLSCEASFLPLVILFAVCACCSSAR